MEESTLLHVVSFIGTRDDALALLTAVPSSVLSPPLTALLGLFQGPLSDDNRYQWPQPRVEFVGPWDLELMLAALPAFDTVRIESSVDFERLFESASIPGYGYNRAFLDFLTKWSTQLGALTITRQPTPTEDDELCRLLHACTRLDDVRLDVTWPRAGEVLALLASPRHRVRRLVLEEMNWDQDNAILDLASALTPWLRSGHATSLVFDNITTCSVEGLPTALALAPSLTRLEILGSDKVIDILLASQTRLYSFTQLRVEAGGHTDTNELHLVKLLPLDKVTDLDFFGHLMPSGMTRDASSLLATLPRLPALQALSLQGYYLRNVSTTLRGPPALRTLALCFVKMGAIMTQISFLDFVARCPSLEHMSWSLCDMNAMTHLDVGDALARCFRLATSLRSVRFWGSHLDTACAFVLANALAGSNPMLSMVLEDYEDLNQAGFDQLAKAVSSGGNVELRYNDCAAHLDDDDYKRFDTDGLADTYRVKVSVTTPWFGTVYRVASLNKGRQLTNI